MHAALLDLKQMYNGCLAKSQAVVGTKSSGQMLHMPECFPHIPMGENLFPFWKMEHQGASASLLHLLLAVSQEVSRYLIFTCSLTCCLN